MTRRLLVLALAVLCAVPGAASAASFVRTDIPVAGGGPDAVKLADLDGRNGLDLVISIYAADKVGVLMNNGAGGLAPMLTYDACNGPVDVELGDVMAESGGLLGDGKLDAVVACVDSGGVARLPGNGKAASGRRARTHFRWLRRSARPRRTRSSSSTCARARRRCWCSRARRPRQ